MSTEKTSMFMSSVHSVANNTCANDVCACVCVCVCVCARTHACMRVCMLNNVSLKKFDLSGWTIHILCDSVLIIYHRCFLSHCHNAMLEYKYLKMEMHERM